MRRAGGSEPVGPNNGRLLPALRALSYYRAALPRSDIDAERRDGVVEAVRQEAAAIAARRKVSTFPRVDGDSGCALC